MFQRIRRLFSGPYLYVRINRDRILARNVLTDMEVQYSTKIAVDENEVVVSVGDPVGPHAVKVIEPFKHPRVFIGDYVPAEKIVHHALKELWKDRLIPQSPVVLLHPDLVLNGGLAPIEGRALREMTESVGARKVLLHYGKVLSDDELISVFEGR